MDSVRQSSSRRVSQSLASRSWQSLSASGSARQVNAPIADFFMNEDGVTHAFNGASGCVIQHQTPCRWAVQPVVVERVVTKVVTKVVKEIVFADTAQKIVDMARAAIYEGVSLDPTIVLAAAEDQR